MHDQYLEHYGVPGMKWGRRKSTSNLRVVESTRNINGNSKNTTSSKKPSRQPKPLNKTIQTKNDIDNSKRAMEDSKRIIDDSVAKMENTRKLKTKYQLQEQASQMSDKELKDVINRLSMEQRYSDVMTKQGYGASKSNLQKTLETVGNTAAVVGTTAGYVSSALTIYLTIQSIRNGR